jgi:sec-independent protein translocase protein TatA
MKQLRIGTTEILLIVVLAPVLFYLGGRNKLADVGKAPGKSIRKYKEEVKPNDEKASF